MIIARKKLEELKKEWEMDGGIDCYWSELFPELLYTIEKLWDVADAARNHCEREIVVKDINLENALSALREEPKE